MIKRLSTGVMMMMLVCGFGVAGEKEDAVLGQWLTASKTVKLEIVKKDGKYSGKIVWMKDPVYADGDPEAGKPLRDRSNPKAELQSRPLVGLNLIADFTFDGDGTWTDGTIYDPESGKTYSCNMTMPDENTLNVRGYIGVPTFGRTEVWSRAPKNHPEEEKAEIDGAAAQE